MRDNKKLIFITTLFSLLSLCLLTGYLYALNIDRVKMYFLRGDYDAAISEGESLISGDNKSSELYYFLGLSYLKRMEYPKAANCFSLVINNFGDNKLKEESRIALADVYYLKGDLARAKEIYEELLRDYPKTKFREEIRQKLQGVGLKASTVPTAQSTVAYYPVQVGSFADINNAKKLTRKLTEGGFSAYMEESYNLNKKAYPVRVGKFKSRSEAEQLSRELSRKGYPIKICP